MKNKKVLSKEISAEIGMGSILLIAIIISGVFYLKSEKEPALTVAVNNQAPVSNKENNYLPSDNNNKTYPADISASFQYAKDKGFSSAYGTLNLTGYLNLKQSICGAGEECSKAVTRASFEIIATDNNLIYDFLNDTYGNSYVGKYSVILGCYEKDAERIYSVNYGDDKIVESIITGNDLQKLLDSNKSNLIKLQIVKPIFTSGGGAPDCYSHFRSFKILP